LLKIQFILDSFCQLRELPEGALLMGLATSSALLFTTVKGTKLTLIVAAYSQNLVVLSAFKVMDELAFCEKCSAANSSLLLNDRP
jgi:hypothetical protein